MNPRTFIGLVGGLIVAVGLIFFAAVPITLPDSGGVPLRCGTAMAHDENAQLQYDLKRDGEEVYGISDRVRPDCAGAESTRKMWTLGLAGIGLVVLVGAMIVRPKQSAAT